MDDYNFVVGGLFTICLTFGTIMYNGLKERVNRIEDKIDTLIEHFLVKKK